MFENDELNEEKLSGLNSEEKETESEKAVEAEEKEDCTQQQQNAETPASQEEIINPDNEEIIDGSPDKQPEENKEASAEKAVTDKPEKELEEVRKEEKNVAPQWRECFDEPKEKKKTQIPMFVWIILTVILCGLSGLGGAMYAISKIDIPEPTQPTVVYETVNTGNTTIEVKDLTPVVSNIVDTVVEVYTETVKYNYFYGEYVTSGAGSGVIMSQDGYIITNNHVIENAKSISVTTSDGNKYDATLVGTDAENDIAVIKINATGLKPALFGNSDNLKLGETCIAIGNPLGTLGGTVTDGIVSALSREVTVEGQKMTLLQTNATINPGNSGGGLFNINGELIGIVNAKYSSSDVEGIGFAIPVNVAKQIAEELIETATNTAVIGISCTSINDQQSMNYYKLDSYGVYINDVVSTKAKNAGLKPKDLIIRFDGSKIESFDDLEKSLASHKPGDTVEITVLRSGEQVNILLTLSMKGSV